MITLNSSKWTPDLVKKLHHLLKEGKETDLQLLEDALKKKNAFPDVGKALKRAAQ